jgi:hypothetical protein
VFEKVRIKEPSVPVVSKTLKNRRASGKKQRLSGQLFVFFKKIVNRVAIYQNWEFNLLRTVVMNLKNLLIPTRVCAVSNTRPTLVGGTSSWNPL